MLYQLQPTALLLVCKSRHPLTLTVNHRYPAMMQCRALRTRAADPVKTSLRNARYVMPTLTGALE